MKNKKVLALLVSLVMIVAVALPGTLAVSSDQDAVNSGFTVDTASPAPETASPAPETASPAPETASPAPETASPAPETATPAPETQELTGGQEQAVAPETPEPVLTCTCDPAPAEGEAHAEGCPLAPLSCTCDPAPLEGEPHAEGCPMTCTCVSQPLTGTIHKEGCPLYVDPNAPVVISHIETCLEGCTGEECTCVCHLYEKIMAAETLDEIWMILDEMSDETYNTMTDGMKAKVDEKISTLEPKPAPAIDFDVTEPVVESEVSVPTANYAYVAPFGAPVSGGQG